MENQDIGYRAQHYRNRERVSKVIGHELKTTEVVHTHADGTLVACEGQAYHALLHMRTEALKACGHADWRRCRHCKKYDDPSNLRVHACPGHGDIVHHLECNAKSTKEYEKRNKSLTAINEFLVSLKGTENG